MCLKIPCPLLCRYFASVVGANVSCRRQDAVPRTMGPVKVAGTAMLRSRRRVTMGISVKAPVKRWGGRAAGLAVTGIGLYVVAPSLLTMFGAWPQLSGVEIPWFFILAALQFGR